MRVFVAVRPPPPAVAMLARALAPVERRDLRWVRPGQWHVTLRFLGDDADPRAVLVALSAALSPPPAGGVAPTHPEARLGPTTGWLAGGTVLQVPVAGLDGLAAAVASALAGLGPADGRPFRGHLTLARRPGRPGRPGQARQARQGRPDGGDIPLSPTEPGRAMRPPDGLPVAARWLVTEVAVVVSQLGTGAPVHREVGRVRLPGWGAVAGGGESTAVGVVATGGVVAVQHPCTNRCS